MSTVERHVFVSYCHADAAWLDRLKIHLRPLVRRGALDLWDDSRISPGQTWHEEVAKALARARVSILLVSADFLASDFIVNNELPPVLHRAARGGLLVVPLIVSPCLFSEHEELSRYQCVNSPDKPLSGMSRTDAEAALVSLCRSIDQYFHYLDTSQLLGDILAPGASPYTPTSVMLHAGERFDGTGVPLLTPPSRYGPLVVERPLNLSFDGSAPDGMPVGWFNSFGHVSGVSTDYGICVVRRSADRAAGMCAVLEKATSAVGEFGSLMQRCPGRFLAGRTVRIEGELRTENVSGWAGLWLRADADEQPNLFFDNMSRRPVIGTTNWRRHFIDAPLPGNTDWLNYGIVLKGAGVVYADNIRLLVWAADGRWEDV
jgi:TIR domain